MMNRISKSVIKDHIILQRVKELKYMYSKRGRVERRIKIYTSKRRRV